MISTLLHRLVISGCGLPSCSGAFWLVIVPDWMCSMASSDYSSTKTLGEMNKSGGGVNGCSVRRVSPPHWEEKSGRGQPPSQKNFQFWYKNGDFCCIPGAVYALQLLVLHAKMNTFRFGSSSSSRFGNHIQYISWKLCFYITNHTKH